MIMKNRLFFVGRWGCVGVVVVVVEAAGKDRDVMYMG